MDNIKAPFRGIIKDVRGRAFCYKQDWIGGLRSGIGYLLFTLFNLRLLLHLQSCIKKLLLLGNHVTDKS